MAENRIELREVAKLVEELRPIRAGLISFDGCDGAGKTTLAEEISSALRRPVIDLDKFVAPETGEFVHALDLVTLVQELDSALASSPVVLLSGVCMRQVLETINSNAVVSIYVQRNTQAGLPGDIDYIDVESEVEASADVLELFDELNLEVYAYHRAYRPRTKSDLIFIREAD